MISRLSNGVKAAEGRSLDTMSYLAENYEIGEMPVSAEMEFGWYHRAARTNHLKAMCKVTCYYIHGHGNEKNGIESIWGRTQSPSI